MALKDVIAATQADLRANADHAVATFSADSASGRRFAKRNQNSPVFVDGRRTSESRRNGCRSEPGRTRCSRVGYMSGNHLPGYATALGIPLESVSVKLEGSLDLRGFFGVKDDVRAGYNEIRGVVDLKSSASAADLAKLKNAVDAHCPVLDILRAPVPVDLRLKTERASHAA